MFNNDVPQALAVLEAYWRQEPLENSRILRACAQLDDLLQDALPGSLKTRLPRLSEEERTVVCRILTDFSTTNVHTRALIRLLIGAGTSVERPAQTPTIIVEPGSNTKIAVQLRTGRHSQAAVCDTLIWRIQRNGSSYGLHVRSYSSDDPYSIDATPQELVDIPLDLIHLSSESLDHESYGRHLARIMFGDSRVLRSFSDSVAIAQNARRSLRMLIDINPDAAHLHNVHWEKLWSPIHEASISICDGVWFSRGVTSDVRQVMPRLEREKLEVLVAISSPLDIQRYEQTPIDIEVELSAIRAAFAGQPSVHAVSVQNVTRHNLVHHLQQQPDIFYLVCHGKALDDGQHCLYLERDDRTTAPVLASDLTAEIRNLTHRPYLAVLGACYSAGDGAKSVTSQVELRRVFGVQLIEAGLPAVIAMQGPISIETMRTFGSRLLEEFSASRAIDRAVARARRQVRHFDDWWRPCLFLRQ